MVKYSKELYTKEVIFKSAYAFTDISYIHIDVNDDYYIVTLTPKDSISVNSLYERFENELIAQETRRVVSEKTKNIREMIVARSLSSTIIDKEIENDGNNENYNANSILTDWFENND